MPSNPHQLFLEDSDLVVFRPLKSRCDWCFILVPIPKEVWWGAYGPGAYGQGAYGQPGGYGQQGTYGQAPIGVPRGFPEHGCFCAFFLKSHLPEIDASVVGLRLRDLWGTKKSFWRRKPAPRAPKVLIVETSQILCNPHN